MDAGESFNPRVTTDFYIQGFSKYGTPKSSILMGFPLTNHPAIGVPPWLWNPPYFLVEIMHLQQLQRCPKTTKLLVKHPKHQATEIMMNDVLHRVLSQWRKGFITVGCLSLKPVALSCFRPISVKRQCRMIAQCSNNAQKKHGSRMFSDIHLISFDNCCVNVGAYLLGTLGWISHIGQLWDCGRFHRPPPTRSFFGW